MAAPSLQTLRPLASAPIDPPQSAGTSTAPSSSTHFENQPPPIYPTAEEETPGPSGHPGFVYFSRDSRVGTVSYNPQATVQGTPAPDQAIGEPPDMATWTNLPPKRLLLMAVLAGTLWTSLMGVRVFGRGARLAAGALSLVWLGVVLGISFLEAWVSCTPSSLFVQQSPLIRRQSVFLSCLCQRTLAPLYSQKLGHAIPYACTNGILRGLLAHMIWSRTTYLLPHLEAYLMRWQCGIASIAPSYHLSITRHGIKH